MIPQEGGFAQMKFRDPARGKALAGELERLAREIGREPITLMHVCGSHEQAIARFGLRATFPPSVDLIMGPGCPVCVTDLPEVDEAVALAMSGVRVATYGDMLKVPGRVLSLADAQGQGGKVDVVYSVSQAVDLARSTDEEVVFFSTGFETTAVATAAVILSPDRPKNFSVLSAHKYILPAMEIVAEIPGSRIEGFLGAGHAATITGWGIFEPFAAKYNRPVVVAGFEPLDIIQSIYMLLRQIDEGRCEVENQYTRVVRAEGNLKGLDVMRQTMELRPYFEWRGLGFITHSALKLRPEFAQWDAELQFEVPGVRVADPKACQCGEVLKGVIKPWQCKVFGTACTPDHPIGTCMVSSEGACTAYYNYGRFSQRRDRQPVAS